MAGVDPRDPLPPQPTPAQIAMRRARRRRAEALRRARLRRKRMLQTLLLCGVVAVVLVVTSGAGKGPSGLAAVLRHAGVGPGAGVPQHARGFDWVESFAGSPRSVADENRQRGTGAWRLRGARARGHIRGYVAEQSIRPGQTQRVYVDAPRSRWIRIDVYRMGWYGGRGGRLVLSSHKLKPRRQHTCPRDQQTGLVECNWRPSLSFAIPPGLTSGVYVVKMMSDTGAASDSMFVLEAATEAKPSRLLVQLSTATYEAYNSWGGDSLYPGGQPVAATGTTQGVEVSFHRPYKTRTGAGQLFSRDIAAIQFVEREGYDASYTTGPSVDTSPAQTMGHKVLLDVGHSEYWSQGQADAFRRARDAGTNLAFLASNTMVWRVRYAGHRIVAYKEHAASDPDRTKPTGLMPLAGAPIAGTAWQQCVTPRVAGSSGTTYHYYPWRPSAALQPDWLFKDTGFTASSQVPGIVGYEPDRTTPASPPGTQIVGSGNTLCQAHGPLLGTGQSTLYTAPSGALVFSSGTLGWQLALSPVPDESPDVPRRPDPRLVKLT
ncbi:MAG: hypothetical protein QOE38_1893, partial [Thermoleophilaceae bacterium]|nr:hypothetical protein [Thermoleophilaceae bacterium]